MPTETKPTNVFENQEKVFDQAGRWNGRYTVTRSFELGDLAYEHSIECNNPAWGQTQLDDWMTCITTRATNLERKAA